MRLHKSSHTITTTISGGEEVSQDGYKNEHWLAFFAPQNVSIFSHFLSESYVYGFILTKTVQERE